MEIILHFIKEKSPSRREGYVKANNIITFHNHRLYINFKKMQVLINSNANYKTWETISPEIQNLCSIKMFPLPLWVPCWNYTKYKGWITWNSNSGGAKEITGAKGREQIPFKVLKTFAMFRSAPLLFAERITPSKKLRNCDVIAECLNEVRRFHLNVSMEVQNCFALHAQGNVKPKKQTVFKRISERNVCAEWEEMGEKLRCKSRESTSRTSHVYCNSSNFIPHAFHSVQLYRE